MIPGVSEITERYTQAELREMIERYVEASHIPRKINVIDDTSEFINVGCGDVVVLDDRPYLIREYQQEGCFGVDDQKQSWVKPAIDLITGDLKIIKMACHEEVRSGAGVLTFECFRSPRKEARMLALLKGHPHFMQGFGVLDSAGNIVRIVDHIPGKTILENILCLYKDHEEYFREHFPSVLEDYIKLVESIKLLHDFGEKHGNIKIENIIRDDHNNSYRWINFDVNYIHKESFFSCDLFGLGSVLICLAGCGDITKEDLKKDSMAAKGRFSNYDFSIVFQNRLANLKKIYPYIPEKLNQVFLRFSTGANAFFDGTAQFVEELHEVRDCLSSN